MYFKIMKMRIACYSKHSTPFNAFFKQKYRIFKIAPDLSRAKSVLICKIQSILVPPHFRLVPHHFVCSGDGTIRQIKIFALFL